MSGHIVLIGLSGSGKSTVGGLLARRLARHLYDTDALIAARAGRPVPELLRADAATFRRLEEEVVGTALAGEPGVVATGGGAVLSPRSRLAMRDGNLVVWLQAPVATLTARLAAGEERPLLAGDTVSRLSMLETERAALYAECAGLTISTEILNPDEVVQAIVVAAEAQEVWHAC